MKKELLLSLGCLSLLAFRGTESFAQATTTGPSSSQSPYVVPSANGVKVTSILTAGDMAGGYQMVGLPDGSGAFDNGDGTFTLVVNHEFGNSSGVVHAHGQKGSFNSKWIIKKSDLTVMSGEDLQKKIFLFNTATQSYIAYNAASPSASAAFSRYCSGTLPVVSAFYNSKTGKGTQARFMMNGEENGSEGRAMAHIVTGPEAGNSYELPYMGKCSWENVIPCPNESDTTIVIGTDDATPGQIYVYLGVKQTTGSEIERAGLTGGNLYGIAVDGLVSESSSGIPAANTPFTLAGLGQVQNMAGSAINSASNNAGITNFLRPEDGHWDPSNPNDFYFVTTNSFSAPSRMWRVRFNDISKPSLGGTITAVLDGTEGQKMMDNIGIDHYGNIVIVEDVGGNAHLGKTWNYIIEKDTLIEICSHDPSRFLLGGANYLTQDEETSGVFDAQDVLGKGWWIAVDQAHYSNGSTLVEGGQIVAIYNPYSADANPEVSLAGNGTVITDGSTSPNTADNTDFGKVKTSGTATKTFTIKNAGLGALKVTGIDFSGSNASDFAMVSSVTFPVTIAANDTFDFDVEFTPAGDGLHTATMNVYNNDFDERMYDVAIQATGTSPVIMVQGNSVTIIDGDATAGTANGTYFGMTDTGTTTSKTFNVQNTGSGDLVITGVSFTGANAAEFSLTGAPSFPVTVAPAASQAITVQFAPKATGTRTATINIANDDANTPVYDFALEGMGVDPLGVVANHTANASVKLYPNPTGNEANISVTLKEAEHFTINVTDVNGKLVLPSVEKDFTAGEQVIKLNTSSLNNGIYFVQITSAASATNIKMIVAH